MSLINHEDQLKRENIPSIDGVPTQYRPLGNLLMVIPLPELKMVGSIIIPDRVQAQMNEGHVVAIGPEYVGQVELGDCVTWSMHSEFRLEVDDCKFILVQQANVLMRIPSAELIEARIQREAKPKQPISNES